MHRLRLRGRLPRRSRQIELDHRAAAFLAVDFDGAAGLLGETVDHAQPEAGAAADSLGGEERLEHPVADIGGDSVTGVGDRDHHELSALHLAIVGRIDFIANDIGGLERKLAAAGHGIARIDGEIDDRGRKLRRIGQSRPRIVGKGRDDFDVFAQDRLEQLGGVDDHAVDVDLARLQRLAAREGQKLGGDLGATRGRIVDELGNRGEMGLVRHAFLKDLDRPGDDGEDVVEVMGDAARELADRIHLLGLTQPLLGLVLLGQVGGGSAIAHETTVGGEDRPAVDADMMMPPGHVAARVLEIPERLVPLQHRDMLTPFLRLGLVVGRHIEAPSCRSAQSRSMPKALTRSEM